MATNTYPKLHNATWPGVVGKGTADGEPFIGLDKMIELTANANVNGAKGGFDGPRLAVALGANDQLADAAAYKDLVIAWRNSASRTSATPTFGSSAQSQVLRKLFPH